MEVIISVFAGADIQNLDAFSRRSSKSLCNGNRMRRHR